MELIMTVTHSLMEQTRIVKIDNKDLNNENKEGQNIH